LDRVSFDLQTGTFITALEIYISTNQKKQNELKQQEENGIPYCNNTEEVLGGPLAYA
jgi:hypothetical protein